MFLLKISKDTKIEIFSAFHSYHVLFCAGLVQITVEQASYLHSQNKNVKCYLCAALKTIKNMKQIFIFLVLIIGLFSCQENTSIDDANREKRASSLDIRDLNIYGNFDEMKYLFEQSNDTTYVINFWATWCPPCIKEMPILETLNKKSKDKKVKVILVSLDKPNQFESHLLPFLEEQKINSEVFVLIDGRYKAWMKQINPDWSGEIPFTIIYNKDKRTFVNRALKNEEDLDNFLDEF